MSARSGWFSLHGCTYDLCVELGQTGLSVVIENQHGVDHIVLCPVLLYSNNNEVLVCCLSQSKSTTSMISEVGDSAEMPNLSGFRETCQSC